MRLPPFALTVATTLCLLGCLAATISFAALISNGKRADAVATASMPPTSLLLWDVASANALLEGKRPEPDCTATGGGRRFIVGSQMFPSLNQVPWDELQPDDVVCIPFREEPYRHKIHVMARGAEGHPIRVVGLRGPNGERPVIDADGATSSSRLLQLHTPAPREDLGVITLHGRQAMSGRPPRPWQPGFITISGLKIKGARPDVYFTNANGKRVRYDTMAAGIHIDPADNVVIEDCEITDNSIGIFAGSHEGDKGTADRATQHLTIRGNYIHDNGDPLHRGQHNVSIEAYGCNVIGNYLALTPRHLGANYKSRCTGESFQANYLRGGRDGLAFFDFPLADLDPLRQMPSTTTLVAGNTLDLRLDVGSARSSPCTAIRLGASATSQRAHHRGTLAVARNMVLAASRADQVDVMARADLAALGSSVNILEGGNLVLEAGLEEAEALSGGLQQQFPLQPAAKGLDSARSWHSTVARVGPKFWSDPACSGARRDAGEYNAFEATADSSAGRLARLDQTYEFMSTATGPWFRAAPPYTWASPDGAV